MRTVSAPRGRGNKVKASYVRTAILVASSFLAGCAFCATFLVLSSSPPPRKTAPEAHASPRTVAFGHVDVPRPRRAPDAAAAAEESEESAGGKNQPPPPPPPSLSGLRVLVAIASFDFGQVPHLEDVLDSYHDLCAAGARVDVVVHSTEPYPVPFVDLLNSRLNCYDDGRGNGLKVTVSLRSPAVRLNLVDFHRELFYDRIDDHDLFIYSEVRLARCAPPG